MSEIEENTTIIIFGKFGIPKSVFYTLLTAMILGAVSLSFAFVRTTSQTNQQFPDEQKKAAEVDQKANALRIDVEVIKQKVSNTDAKVDDLKKDMNSGIDRIEKRLNEMSGQNKMIIQQTK